MVRGGGARVGWLGCCRERGGIQCELQPGDHPRQTALKALLSCKLLMLTVKIW